ncbi:MAG TPA: hypothetical protein EYG86_08165 [Crocinitomicaceae bacterium]|nr:hypothetical protein [Crocinitomicaceae bacterium]
MFKKYKIQFFLLFFLLIGGVFIQILVTNQENAEKQRIQAELQKSHKEVVLRIETGINVYATVVSSIRSYIRNSESFPSGLQLQSYLKDLVAEIDFNDSIVLSFVDTSHVFQYVVTPYQIDPAGLVGKNVKDFRTKKEIAKLDELMKSEEILLYSPINLHEGWAAFPFDFAATDNNGIVHGYIAPVLSVKYLLSYSYKSNDDSLFVHQFSDENGVDFSREVVYDNTPIYNKRRDDQFYLNFNIDKSQFVYSDIDFYGLKLTIGTAYKTEFIPSNRLAWTTYFWYFLLCFFTLVFLFQYAKNNKLRLENKEALISIEEQNIELESNLENTQVLIKEVHHRVKNNMQIMTSLMNLQSNESNNEEVTEVLEVCKGRIQSMALVHEKLYSNKSLASIRVKDYVELLVGYIERAFDSENSNPEKRLLLMLNYF